jgi:hypothetical protein
MMLRDCLREVRWAWQRVWRGWDDRVTWDIAGYLSGVMPAWVRKMRAETIGYPAGPGFEDLPEAEAVAKWDAILTDIADGFAAHNAEEDVLWGKDETLEVYNARIAPLHRKRDKGLVLFMWYFGSLWW